MSNYTKSTNFATKDNLTPGDPLKIVRGTEIDTEFNNIATAIATKTDNASAAITGGSITGITDLAIADGGTGASTATAAINNLLPSQTSNANKYLQTDGTNVSWDAVSLSTSDITGTLPVANGGTGVTSSTGTGSVVLSNSPTLVTPALGTPASGVATNLTGLPISTGVSGLGTGVATFLGTPSSANLASAVSDETGSGALVFANSPTLVTPALGTPSSATLTNATGLPISTGVSGLGTGVATFLATPSSANLASAVSDETGSGALVFANSPTLVTPALGTPSSGTLTNATGLPISTGVSGLGTGVATALAVNVGSAGAPVVNGGALGTPSSGTVTNLTGTASININGTVGATTPTTGAFTTLAASSSVTLSGGTANGVTYLNGSKVLTSGSALTFDGTNLGVNCTATNFGANYRTIEARGATTTTSGVFRASSSDASQKIDFFIDSGVGTLRTDSNHPLAFAINNTEGMRLTSTGLGIGTSSPAQSLHVKTSTSATPITLGVLSNATGLPALSFNGAYASTTMAGIYANGATSTSLYYEVPSGNSHFWGIADSTKMTLDSAGNLGLGVTPSTTNYGKWLFIGSTGNSVFGASNDMNMTANAYYNSNWLYGTSTFASRYQQASGQHVWFTAPSGTAGGVISFTQAMTLDASGNLGVGTTSPVGRVDIQQSTTDMVGLSILNTNGAVGTTTSSQVRLGITNSAGVSYAVIKAQEASADDYPALTFAVQNAVTTTPTERARIDSSGNLLIGTTSTAYSGQVVSNANGAAIAMYALNNTDTGSSQQTIFDIYRNGTRTGSISHTNSLTIYSTTSDYRLKTVIGAVTGQGARIDALEPIEYTWTENGSRTRGFLAHKFQEVYADSVSGTKDAVDANGNPLYQGMQAATSEVIADLVAEIQSLRQRLAVLEAK